MQPVLDHQRHDRRDLDQLMAQGIRILSLQQGAAAAAGIRVVLDHLIHPLDRQQLRICSGMAQLAAALTATALAALWRLEALWASAQRWPGPLLEGGYCVAEAWRLGGDTRAAADPLPQAGQFCSQGGELGAELLGFLLMGQDQLSGPGWRRQPVRC
jgi:hypothetical protein